MNREELEKMFNEQVTYGYIYDEQGNDLTLCLNNFIFDTLIIEVLRSILPEYNKQTYISTYKNYIKPKAKELYNIKL